jgi:hypothetical protein
MLQSNQLIGFGAGDAGGGAFSVAAIALGSGTNFMDRSTDSADVNTKNIIISFWFKMTGGDGAHQDIISGPVATERIRVRRNSSNVWDVRLLGTDGGDAKQCVSTNSFTTASTWHHFLFACSGTAVQMVIDGSDVASVSINSDVTLQHADAERHIFAGDGSSNLCNMDVAEIYINTDETLDISDSANVQKFRSAEGKPVDLGADGSTPTGNQPNSYFKADASTPANIVNNLGKGGNMSFTGTPAAASNSPSD